MSTNCPHCGRIGNEIPGEPPHRVPHVRRWVMLLGWANVLLVLLPGVEYELMPFFAILGAALMKYASMDFTTPKERVGMLLAGTLLVVIGRAFWEAQVNIVAQGLGIIGTALATTYCVKAWLRMGGR